MFYSLLIINKIFCFPDSNHIPYAYGIFAFITLFSMVFVNWYLPETHMKSLEEIELHYNYDDPEEDAIDEENEN